MYEGDDLDFDMSVGGDSETDFEQEAMQVQLMKIEEKKFVFFFSKGGSNLHGLSFKILDSINFNLHSFYAFVFR